MEKLKELVNKLTKQQKMAILCTGIMLILILIIVVVVKGVTKNKKDGDTTLVAVEITEDTQTTADLTEQVAKKLSESEATTDEELVTETTTEDKTTQATQSTTTQANTTEEKKPEVKVGVQEVVITPHTTTEKQTTEEKTTEDKSTTESTTENTTEGTTEDTTEDKGTTESTTENTTESTTEGTTESTTENTTENTTEKLITDGTTTNTTEQLEGTSEEVQSGAPKEEPKPSELPEADQKKIASRAELTRITYTRGNKYTKYAKDKGSYMKEEVPVILYVNYLTEDKDEMKKKDELVYTAILSGVYDNIDYTYKNYTVKHTYKTEGNRRVVDESADCYLIKDIKVVGGELDNQNEYAQIVQPVYDKPKSEDDRHIIGIYFDTNKLKELTDIEKVQFFKDVYKIINALVEDELIDERSFSAFDCDKAVPWESTVTNALLKDDLWWLILREEGKGDLSGLSTKDVHIKTEEEMIEKGVDYKKKYAELGIFIPTEKPSK